MSKIFSCTYCSQICLQEDLHTCSKCNIDICPYCFLFRSNASRSFITCIPCDKEWEEEVKTINTEELRSLRDKTDKIRREEFHSKLVDLMTFSLHELDDPCRILHVGGFDEMEHAIMLNKGGLTIAGGHPLERINSIWLTERSLREFLTFLDNNRDILDEENKPGYTEE